MSDYFKETGGPAFPELNKSYENEREGHTEYVNVGGMTLRDYFAAKVLPTMIIDGAALEAIKSIYKKTGEDAFALTAKAAYAYADAMLAERQSS